MKNAKINIDDFLPLMRNISEISLRFCNLTEHDIRQVCNVLQDRLIPVSKLEFYYSFELEIHKTKKIQFSNESIK